MGDNPLQFAVVREDAEVEARLLEGLAAPRVLLVASGGCTALSLQSWFPGASIVLFDPNPAQLAHVREKVDALQRGAPPSRFNVGDDTATGLNQRGNFEALFFALRAFLHHLVAPAEDLRRLLRPDGEGEGTAAALRDAFFASRYWPVAFELFFSDPLLRAMFGPAALQHAPRGAYPAYFRGVFERGLRREDAGRNPFLHHALLGCYLPGALPRYLSHPPARLDFSFVEGTLDDVTDLDRFDLVGMSNVFDWMDRAEVARTAARLRGMRPGATLLFRQLGHEVDFRPHFADGFAFDDGRGAALNAQDRALFYSRHHVAVRR